MENVLISKSPGGTPTYKLCDFGSTAPPRPAAKTTEEGRLIEEDVQKHTTMQYRSPEMIDVWRKQPIDEKADIWALGVLLYKLCYYTTPFEAVGQMAILNASFKFPPHPHFSDRLKKLISWLLKENPRDRPNIYQVIKEVCSMRGTKVPIQDIYADRTHSEVRRNESLPSPDALSSAPVGLQKTTPQVQVQQLPEITPMRRGRPTAPSQQVPPAAKQTPAAASGDPFAALDSKNYDIRAGAVDELSKRFPSLDEFSIAHNGDKYSFSSGSKPQPPTGKDRLNERVTNALADEVFNARIQPTPSPKPPEHQSTAAHGSLGQSSPARSSTPVHATKQSVLAQPMPLRQGAAYKSTAVGSSPPRATMKKLPEISKRPIWRVPDHSRSSSQPRASGNAQAAAATLKPSLPPAQRPALLDVHRSKSQTATLSAGEANSSRPSLEGHRPSAEELDQSSLARTRSLNARSRPSSMYVSSNMDYLRDQEQQRKRPSLELRRHSRQPSQNRESGADDAPIPDDIDYLRSSEQGDRGSKTHHKKRSSLGQIGSNAKSMLSGRFGDAFKRFESNEHKQGQGPMTPEALEVDDGPQLLSPITGSEATASRHSDMEEEDLPPDLKRELERRRLSDEEKRVAAAAEEYRNRMGAQGSGPANPVPTRANTIQQRVQSLLDEGRQSPVPRRTAEGYGKYTDVGASEQSAPSFTQPNAQFAGSNRPPVTGQKPPGTAQNMPINFNKIRRPQAEVPPAASTPPPPASTEVASREPAPLQRVVSRPSAPPKPKALRTGGPVQWPPGQSTEPLKSPPPTKSSSGLAALLAKDLEGVPDYPPAGSSSSGTQPTRTTLVDASPTSAEDLETFSKRYPSLSGIEMVETEIDGQRRMMRVKEI